MRVRDAMTSEVRTVDGDTTIQEAARLMLEKDIGSLPISHNGRVIGMVTDRDITVRAVASGKRSDTRVRDIMSNNVSCCRPGDELDEALDEMSEQKVRRMPVLGEDGQLIGMLSVGDIVCIDDDFRSIGRTLRDICTPHGIHSQVPDAAA